MQFDFRALMHCDAGISHFLLVESVKSQVIWGLPARAAIL